MSTAHAYQTVPPRQLLANVVTDFAEVQHLLTQHQPLRLRTELCHVGGQMAALAERYPQPMTQPDPHVHGDTVAQFAAVGISVTPEGKARARRRLEDAAARRTPERRAAWRRQLGIEPTTTA
jgi:hypothetical protein